jgi:hypothetical protein
VQTRRFEVLTPVPSSVRWAGWLGLTLAGLILVAVAAGDGYTRAGLWLAAALAVPSVALLLRAEAAYIPSFFVMAIVSVFALGLLVDEPSALRGIALVLALTPLVLLASPPALRWWRTRRHGWGAVWAALLGAGVFVSGAVSSPGDIDGVTAAGFGALGSALVGTAVFFWPLATRPQPEIGSVEIVPDERGLIFYFSQSRMLAATVVVALVGIGFPLLTVAPDRPVWLRVLGIALGAFMLLFVLAALRQGLMKRRYVALLPSGIAAAVTGYKAFVAWDDIESVRPVSVPFQVSIGIRATDPGRIRISWLDGLLIRGSRPMTGADLVFPVSGLESDPAQLLKAARFYLERPEKRDGLGDAK